MDILKDGFPDIPDKISSLVEMASNLWWSWHPEARMLFKILNREAWKESVHNPIKMLEDLPGKILESAADNPEYLRHYDAVLAQFRHYVSTRGEWFWENVADPGLLPIAYFSAEYGLHRSLPFYAGGLGFLAGDYLKECSDLGVPLVAIGFMYPEGYVCQKIREDGWQEGSDEPLDRDATPITRVQERDGKQLVVRIPLIEPPIYVALWKVAVGRITLYLMDTDIDMNDPWNRGISARLYIGDMEQRLRQEIVLGIGGYQVLGALGIKHSVLHLNEGHPAFALLERIRERIQEGMSYEEATHRVRSSSIFTTHTPVPAGHDVFPFQLMEKYFSAYWPGLGIDRETFFHLGSNPEARADGFNMTAFALKMCTYCNAVSKRHGEVTRRMWNVLWQELPDKIPIDNVTNGVHVPTWVEPKTELLFNKYLGPNWLEDHDDSAIWELIDDIPDEELWHTHYWSKVKLINFIRERVRKRWVEDRINPSITLAEGVMLDPSALTIGFARRFATYKRANLIFSDRERLKKILNDPWHPVQIIFAGKAHPEDMSGKHVLQDVFNAARDPEFGGRIAFIEDYGEQLAQYMVHGGVDVWLNNPLPPMEASGTSGMKAALNGVPHLSIMDGWWIEGFNGKNGWAFGQEEVNKNRDQADAWAIYKILENEVIPLYYKYSDDDIPHDWVKVMKESIKSNGPRFSARRMVKEYTQKFYVNALKEIEVK